MIFESHQLRQFIGDQYRFKLLSERMIDSLVDSLIGSAPRFWGRSKPQYWDRSKYRNWEYYRFRNDTNIGYITVYKIQS